MLGVDALNTRIISYTVMENLNDYLGNGLRVIGSRSGALNMPTGASEVYGLDVTRESAVRFQIVLANMPGAQKMYYRTRWTSADVWTAWTEL